MKQFLEGKGWCQCSEEEDRDRAIHLVEVLMLGIAIERSTSVALNICETLVRGNYVADNSG
jgi:hypothetical protein